MYACLPTIELNGRWCCTVKEKKIEKVSDVIFHVSMDFVGEKQCDLDLESCRSVNQRQVKVAYSLQKSF